MAQVTAVLYPFCLYAFAVFNWCLYLGLSLRSGSFFKKHSEQDKLQLAIARDQFWNLSKSPLPHFVHRFYKLRNGLQLHYIVNRDDSQATAAESGNLAILIHGFPDSSMEWRHLLQTQTGLRLHQAILVCVDLPGYGGSDSFEHYGPDDVLEALAEFIIGMRETYLEDMPNLSTHDESKTYVVAHDWGCVLAFRLASEAASLADRWILMNGPHAELAWANMDRILKSSSKIFKQFKQNPRKNRACLSKAIRALGPLAVQVLLFGYIAVFHLPPFMVKYLAVGGNCAFLRGAQKIAYGKHPEEYKMQESMACTLGPSLDECNTRTSEPIPEMYGKTVLARARSPGALFMEQTAYYRDGAALKPWNKSLETIADLHSIELGNANGSPLRRRSSSASSTLFEALYKGSLHAPSTVLWGQMDQACSQSICLDGIGDYLARDSEVVLLPRTGHWTPIEKESREALARVLEWFVVQGNVVGDVGGKIKDMYEGATVLVRK